MANLGSHLWLLCACLSGCASAGDPSNNSDPGGVDAGHGNTAIDARPSSSNTDAAPLAVDGSAPSGSCSSAFTGTLATYDFTSASGSQTSTASSGTASGVTAGAITRSSALTATSGTSSINSTNWSMDSQPDNTKYYTLTLSAPSGCTLAVSGLSIETKASASGPSEAAVATSADSFAATVTIAPSASSTPVLSASVASGDLELRVYGYGASSMAGTMRIADTLTVTGSLQ